MAENLNVGTRINSIENQTNNGIIEKYCYKDSIENCDIYGGLYELNETMQYITTPGAKGICPSGWHVPTDNEWTILTTYLEGDNIAGGKMKSTGTLVAGTGLWKYPNTDATNESGFTALPAGRRHPGGVFVARTLQCDWWSSFEYSASQAWDRNLNYNLSIVIKYSYVKDYACAVRCIKD